MRNKKEGFLTNQWKDVYEKNKVSGEKRIIIKENFEEYYGDFISAVYIKEGDDLPYCIWTKKYIVTFENHPLGVYLKSFPRNPTLIQFG